MTTLTYRHPKPGRPDHEVDEDNTTKRLILERAGYRVVAKAPEKAPRIPEPAVVLPTQILKALSKASLPPEDTTLYSDEDLLSIPGIGEAALIKIRELYPYDEES